MNDGTKRVPIRRRHKRSGRAYAKHCFLPPGQRVGCILASL